MTLTTFQRLVLIGIAQLLGPLLYSERSMGLAKLLLRIGCGDHTESQQQSLLGEWCDKWAEREDRDVNEHVSPKR